MVDLTPTALGWLALGAPLVAVGYLLKVRRWTAPLAGYEEAAALPDDVVVDVAGTTALRVGLGAVGVGALLAVADAPALLSPVFAAAIVLSVGRLLHRLRRYEPADGSE